MQDLSSVTLGIKPMPPAMDKQSPNYWTTREFPLANILTTKLVTDNTKQRWSSSFIYLERKILNKVLVDKMYIKSDITN